MNNKIICLFESLGGYIMFKSKYVESQFRKSSSAASFITGFARWVIWHFLLQFVLKVAQVVSYLVYQIIIILSN